MIKAGSYIRLHNQFTENNGCVFLVSKVEQCMGYKKVHYKFDDRNTLIAYVSDIQDSADKLEEVPLSEVPENLYDQPCYKKSRDFFDVGDRVLYKDQAARVYATYNSRRMIIVLVEKEDFGLTVEVFWDELTLVSKASENTDYITGKPITGKSYEICDGNRLNDNGDGLAVLGHIGFKTWRKYTNNNLLAFDEETDNIVFRTPHFCETDAYGTCVARYYFCNSWYRCDRCGKLVRDPHMHEDTEGYIYCDECWQEVASVTLHRYSYKPTPIMHAEPNDNTNMFFGVELEIDDGNDRKKCLKDLLTVDNCENLFYCKTDGSLSSSGIEIVSHPCTINYHMNDFPWESIISTARANNYRSHDTDTCGLHIHVSRNALGENTDVQDLNIAKIILLVDRFWESLVKFSRRRYSALENYACKPNADIRKGDSAKTAIEKSKGQSADRYRAVNITNSSTIEFRIFRGTLKLSTLKASLQLVYNIVNICKDNDLLTVQDLSWDDIISYHNWPELNDYIEEREVI